MRHAKITLLAVLLVCWADAVPIRAASADPVVRLEGDSPSGTLSHIGWDTEGGDRAAVNLLRAKTAVTVRVNDRRVWRDAKAWEVGLAWAKAGEGFDLTATLAAQARGVVEIVSLTFPFDPRASAVTVLPGKVEEDELFRFPAIVSAPGSGQMVVTPDSGAPEAMTLEGSRAEKRIDWTAILSLRKPEREHVTLHFRPVVLPAPEELKDERRWKAVRRAWFNVFQVSARWGDRANPASAPAGVLSNNVISDPVSCCLFIYADLALFTPDFADGVSAMRLVGHTLDWWVDKRMLPSGEIPGYWNLDKFLDANPSILISAWDYVEATGDRKWLAARIGKLEKVVAFLATRDIDGDGLLEAVQSGDSNTLRQPARSCSAFDAINCGHKDAYCNILAYRAFRCMADLEGQLGRGEQQNRFASLADRLKASFAKTMINPKTGFVIMWQSRDGAVHDYAAPSVNALAIEYGLVPPEQGREILKRLRAKMDAVGFKRFDLGIPCTLDPVRRADYLLDAPGCSKGEDGVDTFGQYLNGGVMTGDGVRYTAACYTVGLDAEGDRVLDAMLARLAKGDLPAGGFPVNIVDEYPAGGEFFTWEGKTCGYEGLLSHAWYWVNAVAMREPALRKRLHRPMDVP